VSPAGARRGSASRPRADRTGGSPARAVALTVVRRVFERGAYADRALAAEVAGLDRRERALATQLAYGTVQRRATLDHLARRLARRPLDSLEPVVLAGIRLGLYQILYMDSVPDHAAVDQTVALVKRSSRAGAGFVNAVLRAGAERGRQLLAALCDQDPEGAALAHSVPRWLAELWWEELGAERARSLLRAVNRPPESALRVNPLVSDTARVRAQLPVGQPSGRGAPGGDRARRPV